MKARKSKGSASNRGRAKSAPSKQPVEEKESGLKPHFGQPNSGEVDETGDEIGDESSVESGDETGDETSVESGDETGDESVDESGDETGDETSVESVDETGDETSDEFNEDDYHDPDDDIIDHIIAEGVADASPEDREVLFREVDELYGRTSKAWMRIGKIVSFLVSTRPRASVKERQDEFEAKLKMSYGTAMRAMRVFHVYWDSPEEVAEMGFDVADRLKVFNQRYRREIWKQTRTQLKVREFMQSQKAIKKRPDPQVIRISADEKWTRAGYGVEVRTIGDIGYFQIDFKKFSRDRFADALGYLTGALYEFEK